MRHWTVAGYITTRLTRGNMTVHEHGKGWFLAQLKPNCARIAENHLARQGFETFLPL